MGGVGVVAVVVVEVSSRDGVWEARMMLHLTNRQKSERARERGFSRRSLCLPNPDPLHSFLQTGLSLRR